MSTPPPLDAEIADAQRRLAVLQAEEISLAERVVALRHELASSRAAQPSAQLQEANEHLVLAVLQAQTQVETAAGEFDALARASQRDALCDIPNRNLMRDRLDSAIALARRHGGHLALLFLDIDHFKHINDSLGHATGDEVLRQVARRLESAVRDSDTVSRHGGDEFLILLSEIAHATDAERIAAKMLAAVNEPCHIGPHTLRLSVSIGIALYPEDGKDAAGLTAAADKAMYRVKGSHRSGGAHSPGH